MFSLAELSSSAQTAPVVSDRHRALVDRWVRAIRAARGDYRPGEHPESRFAKSGSLEDLVDVVVNDAAAHVYCCEQCDFPVRDPVMHPAAVIDAMLDRRVGPRDALRALRYSMPSFAIDAAIEAIPESTRRVLCESDDSRLMTPLTAVRLGVVIESIREWDRFVGDVDGYSVSSAFYDAFDPTRRSLPLRALLGSSSRRWFLDYLWQDDDLARARSIWPWLQAPDATRLVLALLSESSGQLRDATFDGPRLVAVDNDEPSFDLRESYVLLCSHFGHDSLAEQQFRRLIEQPSRRSFDGIEVSVAPHPTTTHAVIGRATPEARAELAQWTYSVLERRDARANEWLALAQWSSQDRADECFARALAIIERSEEPFDGALLPPSLQERTWAISERRARAWIDARAKTSRVDDAAREGDHFRCWWFSPKNPAAIRFAYPLIERGVVAIESAFGATVRRWLAAADACFDATIDQTLDELEPLHATRETVLNLSEALSTLGLLLELASSPDRLRWIDALVGRCPTAYTKTWPWASDSQRDRMLAHVHRSARACASLVSVWPPGTNSLELVAASNDRWVQLGCPLDRRFDSNLVAVRRYYSQPGRDPARNAWQLSSEALRERCSAQLAEGSLDWVVDPGPWWIEAMLGPDPSSHALLVALFEQHYASGERFPSGFSPDTSPFFEYTAAARSVDVDDAPAESSYSDPRQALSDRLKSDDFDDAVEALREAAANRGIGYMGNVIEWIARVAPDRFVAIGDRVIDLILTHHAIEPAEDHGPV